jgi:hypothetical protein
VTEHWPGVLKMEKILLHQQHTSSQCHPSEEITKLTLENNVGSTLLALIIPTHQYELPII